MTDDTGERAAAERAETFEQLVQQSREATGIKNGIHAMWLQKFESWNLDQDEGLLQVQSNLQGVPVTVTAPAQIVGSLNLQQGTWMWGWANSSIVDALKRDAGDVLAFGERKGFDQLTTSSLDASRETALDLACVAAHVCSAQGLFVANAGAALIYITFGTPKIEKENQAAGMTSEPSRKSCLGVLLAIVGAMFIGPIVFAIVMIAIGR